ncbi:hypothetical protein FS837_004196 [Tulasnella sp. UAMH 9824]|nr:hypothetical protein FS837_004196 [Tulasnella sp. UAMH 9824]
MQGNKDHSEDRSQMRGPGKESSPSGFPHSYKLRNKLEKLVQWRIHPSLIEFPQDTREFCGGFAKVSQGVLTAPSRAAGVAIESEQGNGEEQSSEAARPQSNNITQETSEQDQHKHEEADGRTAGGDKDEANGEARKEDDGEQNPHEQTSIPEIDYGSACPEHSVNAGPNLGDCNSQLENDPLEPDGDGQGKGEGTGSRIAGDDTDQTEEESRRGSRGAEDRLHADRQSSTPKVGDSLLLGTLALKESEFLVELSHPNIVKLEGFVADLSEQKVWLIFPWEEHGSLRDFLASGEWEIPERISLLNILVNSKCHALITDFGSARHLRTDEIAKRPKENEDKPQPAAHPNTGEEQITLEALFSATASTLTLTGSSYTLRWAAPELLQDERPCLRSDIWSLGWIAYEPWIVPAPTQTINAEASELRRAQLLNKLGLMYRKQADYPNALSFFNGALDIYTNHKNNHGRAETLRHMADVHRFWSRFPEALTFYSTALLIHADLNDEFERATAMFGLATTHALLREYDEAVKIYSECLEIYTKSGGKRERALILWGLADVHRLREECSDAIRLYSEALQIYTDVSDLREKAVTLWGLAEVHRFQQEYSKAIDLYSEALQIYTNVGDRKEKALTLWGLAEVHRSRGEYNEAINLYTEALQIYTEIGDHNQRARTLWDLAQVHRFREEYSEAKKLYSEALQIWTETGEKRGAGTALWGLAKVHRAQHEYNEAIKRFTEARQTFTDLKDKSWISETLINLAETNHMRGRSSEAISLYTQASEVLADLGYSIGASNALENASAIRATLTEATPDATETVNVGEEPIQTSV